MIYYTVFFDDLRELLYQIILISLYVIEEFTLHAD